MSKNKIKDLKISKVENGPPLCPHCDKSIVNYMNNFYNRRYSCLECGGRYFIIKISNCVYNNLFL